MKRTLEKLAEERRAREEEFVRIADELARKVEEAPHSEDASRLDQSLAALEESLRSLESGPSPKKSPFGRAERNERLEGLARRTAEALREFRESATLESRRIRGLLASFLELSRAQARLNEAMDREWDALGSNHVGMIFKSLEWRVDKLAAAAEDAGLLVKQITGLREKLNSLLAALDKGEKPAPEAVRALVEPLEDWRYTGFENRFRGSAEAVRRQQARYIPYFRKEGPVIDLGCGRGEFLDLLRENGIPGRGVDLNSQMVDICRDKGLDCEKGDLLEALARADDNSLAGVFSSQVIEHLTPAYLKKLVEIAHLKLAHNGTIILETVNPASVFALVEIYFLDPSHERPVHPRTLQYLLESAGFADVSILPGDPLQDELLKTLPPKGEAAAVFNADIDALNKLLFSPPNYAAVGRKS